MWNPEQQVVQSKLLAGENLLWFGRPRQGFLFRRSDMMMVPFSLLWCGFAVFWNTSVWYSDAPIFFRIWGLPFLVVGFYFVFGRFIVDLLQRRKTYYGLTNERVVIVSGLLSQTTKAVDLRGLNEITLEELKNGLGTITFGRDEADGSNSWFQGNQSKVISAPNFEQIPDAKTVYERIRNAQKMLR